MRRVDIPHALAVLRQYLVCSFWFILMQLMIKPSPHLEDADQLVVDAR